MEPFIERQSFLKKWWLLCLPFMLFSGIIIGVVMYKEQDIQGALFGGSTLVLTFVLLGALRLETRVDETGITYRFYPFHFKNRFIPWSEITSVTVRTYSPLFEYGGWGIKGTRKNRAFNISGDQGMQLELVSGKKVLFGTGDKTRMQNYLTYLKTKYAIAFIE